jgi:hypothetical protein
LADNYAKVKSRKYASDDDAENLLAGILDETEDVAKAEQERIEAEIRAKEDEERRRKEEEERRKKEEAAKRLSAELERLEKVEQRRTEKLKALEIEELKERGEWVDPEEERRKLEEKLKKEAELAAMKEAAEQEARRKHAAPQQQRAAAHAAEPQKSGSGMMIGLAIGLAVLLAGGGVAFAMVGGYEIDSATYSKAVFAPKESKVAMVEKGFTPIPKDEPVVQQEEDDDKGKTHRRRRRPRRRHASKSKPREKSKPITGKPKQNKANAKADKLEKMLDTDVFGGGF